MIFLLLLNMLLWIDLLALLSLTFVLLFLNNPQPGDGGMGVLLWLLSYLFFTLIIVLALFVIRFIIRRRIKKAHPAIQFRPSEKDMIIALLTVIVLSVILVVMLFITKVFLFSWLPTLFFPLVAGLTFYLVFRF